MDKISDAIMLKEEASRGTVAIVYGIAGILAGVMFFGR